MPEGWRFAWLYYNPDHLAAVDIVSLPLTACAILGRLLPDEPQTAGLRRAIAGRLRSQLQPEWMLAARLDELAAALDGLQACDRQQIDGQDVALFAKRLLMAETAVGGPYRQAGSDSVLANAFIAQCLLWMAEPLPHVTAFLRARLPDFEAAEPADLAYLAAVSRHEPWLADYGEVLQAALCRRIVHDAESHVFAGATEELEQNLVRRISSNCLRNMTEFTEPFNANTRRMLQEVIQADGNHEIALLAWYYEQAIADGRRLSGGGQRLHVRLGMANVYAWAAYTIYDDFLDDEGQPVMLGTANYSFRAMLRYYRQALPAAEAFQDFVEQVLVTVDQANVLETSQYRLEVSPSGMTVGRLPDFTDRSLLADRALFHIIGPMAALYSSGKAGVGEPAWEDTHQALRHYLIARQLNDDIHDWADDLQAGQASYVVVSLLRHLNVTPGHYGFRNLMPLAREQFWQYVLPLICETALEHVSAARRHLQRALPLAAGSKFVGLIDYVEASMQEALVKRRQGQQLLQVFGPDSSK